MDPKETTLQINKFKGIDRSDDGVNDQPDSFEILQNWHVKSPGELESLGGVESLTTVDLPGVAKVISTEFMKDASGRSLLLAFYRPLTGLSWTPVVTSANFVHTGVVTTGIGGYMVTYVGPGGYVKSKESAAPSSSATTVTFTPPLSIPAWVAQIDIYTPASADTSGWIRMASMRRQSTGLFQASVTFNAARDQPTVASIATENRSFKPDKIESTTVGSPSLGTAKPEIWYFGIAPNFWHPNNKPIINMVDTASPFNFLTAEVDAVNGSTVSMKFALPANGVIPGPVPAPDVRLKVGDLDIARMLPFAGRTPEDLTLVTSLSNATTGNDTSISITTFEHQIVGKSAAADTVNTSVVSGSQFDAGDRVIYRGTTETGLINGNTYYVKQIFGGGYKLYTSFDNYSRDIPVDITAATITGTPKLYMIKVSFYVNKNSLINSRNSMFMSDIVDSGTAPIRTFDGDRNLKSYESYSAIAARTEGIFINQSVTLETAASVDKQKFLTGSSVVNSVDTFGATRTVGAALYNVEDVIGCWVTDVLPFTAATSWQLLPGINHRSLSESSMKYLIDRKDGQKGYGSFWNPQDRNQDFEGTNEVISTTPFGQRIMTANGDNIIWYTNGYVWTPIMRSDGKAQLPQSKYIQAFSNRLIAAGGREAIQNSLNQAYYSEIQTPFDWGTTINSLNVFSLYPINGLGAYSQNLIDQGFSSFCVISKQDGLFVWDGVAANGAKQIYYSFGFAGPRSFAATDYGPVFISRDNAFFIQGTEIKDIGNEVKDIFRGLNDIQLHRVHVNYHNKVLKIAYPSVTTGDPDSDKEVWMELRAEQGGLQKYWSGPHVLKAMYDQASIIEFDSDRDIRISCSGTKIYQRDSGNSNDGSDIERQMQLSRLGLQGEHFLKTLRAFYIAVKITTDEAFTITLDAEDGSDQMVLEADASFSNGERHLLQYSNPDRFLGRVHTITIDQTSSTPVSIYDISIIFKTLRRRLLRY